MTDHVKRMQTVANVSNLAREIGELLVMRAVKDQLGPDAVVAAVVAGAQGYARRVINGVEVVMAPLAASAAALVKEAGLPMAVMFGDHDMIASVQEGMDSNKKSKNTTRTGPQK